MDQQYFVSTTPGAGVIGILTDREIRRRLAAGSLQPTDMCLSTTATGDLKSQWRPLSELFNSAHAEGDGDGGPVSPLPRDGRPLAVEVGQSLLFFGQLIAAIGIAASIFSLFLAVSPFRLTSVERLSLVVGSVWSGAFSAALFVVFTRVKQLPPG